MPSPKTTIKVVRKNANVQPGTTETIGGCLGRFEKGPLNVAKLITSPEDAKELFGDTPPSDSETQNFLEGFFASEGKFAYLVRILGSGFTTAFKNLQTVTTGASPGAVTTTVTFPLALANGDTFLGKVDGGSILTATIVANRPKVDGTGATYATASGNLVLIIQGIKYIIAAAGTESTQALWLNTINTALLHGSAVNNGGQIRIISDYAGSAATASVDATSTPAVLASLGLVAGAFTLTAGSNVGNVEAVTPAELAAVFNTAFTGSATTANGTTSVTWASSTTGPSSSVQFTSGSGVPKLFPSAGDFTLHSGAGTTPVDTMTVSASSPGNWANKYRILATRSDVIATTLAAAYAAAISVTEVQVAASGRISVGDTLSMTNGSGTVRGVVQNVDGTRVVFTSALTPPTGGWTTATTVINETFNIFVYNKDNILERPFTGLRMDPSAGVNYYVNSINNASRTPITVAPVTNVASDARPTTMTLSAYLAGGSDGSAPIYSDYIGDRAAKTGIYSFDKATDVDLISIPGVYDTSTVVAEQAYGEYRQDVLVLPEVPLGYDPAAMITWANNTINFSSQYTATYFPWFKKAELGTGAIDTVTGLGYVQGVIARTHKNRNIGKAPAGIVDGLINGIEGLQFDIDETAYDPLYDANVNATRNFPGEGYAVWGSRTHDSTGEFGQVSTVIVFNKAKRAVKKLTRFVNFEPNNSDTRASVTRVLTSLFRGWREAGVLAGKNDAEAFFVICNESNNTPLVIKGNRIKTRIGLATQNPSEFQEYTLELDTRALDAALAATGT